MVESWGTVASSPKNLSTLVISPPPLSPLHGRGGPCFWTFDPICIPAASTFICSDSHASWSFLSVVLEELGEWPETSSTFSLTLDHKRFPSDLIVLVTDLLPPPT